MPAPYALSFAPGEPVLTSTLCRTRFCAALCALTVALPLALVFLPTPACAQAPAGGGGTATNSSSTTCGWASSCPSSSPCCSEYGFCTAGTGCLAGCNPQGSYGEGYCAPVPVCQSSNVRPSSLPAYTFPDTSRIQTNLTAWDGDATKYDFTLDHQDNNSTSIVQNGELVLVLTEEGGGTRVSTTRSVLYGQIAASIKTVGAAGTVTAFITMSGVKDEIDWEFTTNNTDQGQTNYYWEGDVDNYTHGGEHGNCKEPRHHLPHLVSISFISVLSSHPFLTSTSWNSGINWTPEQLDWTIDGKTVRTLMQANTTNGRYPQTPSRVQFSVWPAGISSQYVRPSEPSGTVEWAGGMIDWSDPSYVSQGYFASYVQWLSIDCYNGSTLAYVASNQTATSLNSTSSRLAKRDDEEYAGLLERQLWKRADAVNSYVYGMLVKGSDTKGVKASGNGSTGVFGNTAVGNWWSKLATAAAPGIIVGICAAALFLFVALCTCFARRNDHRKAALGKDQALADSIPLVDKNGSSPAKSMNPAFTRNANASTSTVDLPGKFTRQNSDYAGSVGSKASASHYYRAQSPSAVPPVPNYHQLQQQQQQLGYSYPAPQPYGYPQQQQHGYGYGGAPPYQQQWQGQGNGNGRY
ncbi:SPOSA6832_01574 [Sporobolomyces salmonicolor]|uniref:SPOSA6832_01574-mRNA-1:cds n=1 Tax=Sporidiobolus salmonicolor TaxID=5005 RepID=A0A0D6EIX9_SPOSA|nr:SPOSA6832_01574 [Sporobolomyces salmonicolor]